MKHVVFVKVADRAGLIHQITGVLLDHRLNIVTNGEFTDPNEGQFFMRSEVEGDCDTERLRADLQAVLDSGAEVKVFDDRKKRIVICATKETHCLGELLIRHYSGELHAEILAVIANHAKLGELVQKFSIPFYCIPHEHKERRAQEDEVLATLAGLQPDYIVLAKYMLVLSPRFVGAYPMRIINIHHSFLPAFIGARPYRQAYQRGVKIIGATAHFVTDNLDEGPIITQKILPVDHHHSVADMSRAGRNSEKLALSKALDLVFEDRVFVHGNRTIIFD